MSERMRVRLVVDSLLSTGLAEWPGELEVAELPDGRVELTGLLADQSAAHGLCNRLRDLGVSLDSLSVEREH